VNHFGAGVATVISGILATPIPKEIAPPGRVIGSDTTNILSIIGYYARISIPRIEFAGLGTTNLFRALGRLNPYIFGAHAAYDVAVLTVDTYKCYEGKTQSSASKP
jgi:hypothetical protein